MDVAEIRQAIADACKIGSDVRVYGYVPGSPVTPCWVIRPLPFDFPMDFEDHTIEMNFSILVLLGMGNAEASQQRLDGWIGTEEGSVVASISADPTLGGVVSSSSVARLDDYGTLEISDGGTQYLLRAPDPEHLFVKHLTVITPTLPERADLMAELWEAMEAQTVAPAWTVLTDYDYEGPVVMFNRIAEKVTTEWLFPLGDDDLIDPDHFATLEPWLDDSVDIVYTWCRIEGPPDYPPERFQVRLQADEAGWEGLRERNWIPASAAIRTSLWRSLGGYREPDWTTHEDWDFWVRALDVGARFRCVPATTWTYRLGEEWTHWSFQPAHKKVWREIPEGRPA